MRKYSLKKFIFIVTAFAAFFCATGCEIIGLGAAVDANPPSLTITLPAVNAAVSSNFNISGTCDDDTGVREVRIVGLKDTENKVAYGTLFNGEDLGTAELPDGANWNVPLVHVPDGDGYNYILNGHTLNLADGTYIAYLTAFDGNRECMDPMPVSFDIDNTPPVFLVSAPSTVEGSEGGKEYGRSVVISGTIADGHDIEKMYVTAYRADGTVIDLEKTEFDVPDKANVSVIMAKYSATSQADYDALPSASQSDERALQHNYITSYEKQNNAGDERAVQRLPRSDQHL
ncbi:MAG: hypothetical protein II114_05945 [Treponema sp.]|nr:hypothetical protein [Treponema sp.]